jgi:hypothetical protein
VQSFTRGSRTKLTLETSQPPRHTIFDVANIILRFPGLKELQLEMIDQTYRANFPEDGSYHLVRARNMKDCWISFQKLLDSQKSRFRGNKAPTVTAFYWTGDRRDDVYTPGYAYSNSMGEKWLAFPWPVDRHEWINFEGGIDFATNFKFAEGWDAEQSEQT